MKYLLTLIIVIAITAVPVAAQEQTTLTLREAVNRAIAHSDSFRRLGEQARLDEMRNIQARNDLLNTEENHYLATAVRVMRYDIVRIFSINNRYDQIEALEDSIMRLYTAITNAEADLLFHDRSIDIGRRRLAADRVRHENGLLSDQDWSTRQREHHQAQLARTSLESTLDQAYQALSEVMNRSSSDEMRYSITFDLPFEPLGSRSLAVLAETAVTNSTALRRTSRDLEVTRFQHERAQGQTELQREEQRLQLDWAERDLRASQDRQRDNTAAIYRNLRNLESTRTIQQEQIQTLRTQLDIGEHRVELGLMTRLDLDQLHLDFDRAVENLRRTEASHALALNQILTPSLIN